jgi:Zn-dependent peptidase ImmA (M78 family)/DNA-binding XRE family transcriptional regulator
VAGAIRDAREARGWSQSELARRLNKTQTAISYWEAGKRLPGIDDLVELAGVLDTTVDVFFPPEQVRRPVTAVLRATAARLADTELQAAIDRLLVEAEEADPLQASIAIMASTPTHAANELLEKAAIAGPPVPVEHLAQLCGVLVFYEDFPDSLSGLVFANEGTAVIGVNANHTENRQRFSLAHELGHNLLGHHLESRGSEDRIHIDTTEGALLGYDWRAERAANEFAAEVLMPRRFISAVFKEAQDPAALASSFAVSEIAMGYRLVNLGLR